MFRQLFFCCWVVVFSFSCSNQPPQKKFVIGFSQCTEGLWRDNMLAEMKRELSYYPNVSLVAKQANSDNQVQVKQIKELLQQKVDLLIVSPNEAGPLTPVVEEAFRKGTPVIVVDRKIASPLYTAYVGGDNYQIGKMAGEYAYNLLKGKGTILEFTILPGSSPAVERHKGFLNGIRPFPSLTYLAEINGEPLREKEFRQIDSVVTQHKAVDLVFAQNDFLAVRIANLYKSKGLLVPKIIGVDGLAGKGEGMDLVSGKTITATMLYPTGGEEAIRTAMKILQRQDFQREANIQTTVIDSTNVRYMQLQAAKTSSQQASIERQQGLLDNLKALTNNQRTFLYILVISLVLAILFGGAAFYALRQNKKIARKLEVQNKDLEEMSAKAQAANEAKVNFFTNISHEFRTPLTLILGPMEEMMTEAKSAPRWSRKVNLVHKNVIRLLRLVNQLMDFRKIEVEKMRLRASEHDLVFFVNDILQSYQGIAQKRSIDLRLLTGQPAMNVWFDANMLDKVLFNLLSNAFKFTNDGGFVHISIGINKQNEAEIKVQDNGVGMNPDVVQNVFNVFYQGEFENQKGSGLGLALSKEIIRLHKGSISVKSEKWKGTTFTVLLPLGKEHLEEKDFVGESQTPFVLYEDEKVYTTDLEPEAAAKREPEGLRVEKEQSILLIEDNEDLRSFVKERLENQYEILEADNGQAGLQTAFDTVPDLIVSDVVIPGKDGMQLVNVLKSDIRTSHIPVILLTGKANVESQIEGMRALADAYITKPFNVAFLEQTIRSLLTNRATLREHFTTELPATLKTQTVSKLDRKFVSEFTAIVESNINNEDFTPDDICRHLHVSRVQLNRKVKALMNVAVSDYILTTRLQKAKYLLQHEDLSISEISYKVGFSSPAYFSTVFKSKFGMTPRDFKEK